VAKGLKVPCLFMIATLSKKTGRLVYAVYPRIPPQYTTGLVVVVVVVNSNDWRVGSRLHVLARAPVRPPRGGEVGVSLAVGRVSGHAG